MYGCFCSCHHNWHTHFSTNNNNWFLGICSIANHVQNLIQKLLLKKTNLSSKTHNSDANHHTPPLLILSFNWSHSFPRWYKHFFITSFPFILMFSDDWVQGIGLSIFPSFSTLIHPIMVNIYLSIDKTVSNGYGWRFQIRCDVEAHDDSSIIL